MLIPTCAKKEPRPSGRGSLRFARRLAVFGFACPLVGVPDALTLAARVATATSPLFDLLLFQKILLNIFFLAEYNSLVCEV